MKRAMQTKCLRKEIAIDEEVMSKFGAMRKD